MINSLVYIIISLLFLSSTSFEDRTMEILTSYKWCVPQEQLDRQRDTREPDDIYILERYYIYDETTCTSYTKWSDEPNTFKTLTVPYYIGSEGSEVRVDREERNGETYATFYPVQFDNSKVGKNRKGNYILKGYGTDGEASIFMIYTLNNQKLVIYNVTPNVASGKSEYITRPKN